jgi:hypothetical protein
MASPLRGFVVDVVVSGVLFSITEIMMKTIKAILIAAVLAISLPTYAQQRPSTAYLDETQVYKGTGSITQGRAETITQSLLTCNQRRSRISKVGQIKDKQGQTWTVPAQVQFPNGPKATDLYNRCTDVTQASLAQVDVSKVPVVNIDPDGEVVTGYLFADNYFELYINGKLIAVDPIPFTPFNSNLVRFRVSKPYDIAVKVVDWEEHLGLGTESNRGKAYHAGDGGFIASFSDGTVTNAKWCSQTFYIAPVYDLSCLTEQKNVRGSKKCTTEGTDEGENAFGIHWPLPADWPNRGYERNWPKATVFTEDEIGVRNKRAYMNFREQFTGAGAQFIWSSNVVLDNEVLLHYRVH